MQRDFWCPMQRNFQCKPGLKQRGVIIVCVSQNLLSNILPSQDENQPTTRQHAATAAGQKCAAMTDTIDLYQCCMQTDCCVCTRMVYL